MKTKEEYLKHYFGYDEFRFIQANVIDSITGGKDTICIMSTGGGKSISFQIPALMLEGLTIVISPLIALMNDQVKALKKRSIKAETLNSSVEYEEELNILNNIKEIKLLYISPEKLLNKRLLKAFDNIFISQIVIDEAHCISLWGHDFRPSYKSIISFIEGLDKRPIISCFSATAGEEVIDDIKSILKLEKANIFKSSFDRPNLYYDVIHLKNKKEWIIKYLKNNDRAGIIYFLTQANALFFTSLLNSSGIDAVCYHGGMTSSEKEESYNSFIKNKTKVICATNSFGMGVDKPDIRFVINYDIPMSIEDLLQQQGRASRDTKYGKCILLVDDNYSTNQFFINEIENNTSLTKYERKRIKELSKKRLQDVIEYAKYKGCLHKYLTEYFKEPALSFCTNCKNCKDYIYRDMKKYINVLRDILDDNSFSSIGKIIEKLSMKIHLRKIVIKDFIIELERRKLLVLNQNNFILDEDKINNVDRILIKSANLSFIKHKNTLEERLRHYRDIKSIQESKDAYLIYTDSTINEMVKIKPKSLDELLNIKGIGDKKIELYGEDILKLIKNKG